MARVSVHEKEVHASSRMDTGDGAAERERMGSRPARGAAHPVAQHDVVVQHGLDQRGPHAAPGEQAARQPRHQRAPHPPPHVCLPGACTSKWHSGACAAMSGQQASMLAPQRGRVACSNCQSQGCATPQNPNTPSTSHSTGKREGCLLSKRSRGRTHAFMTCVTSVSRLALPSAAQYCGCRGASVKPLNSSCAQQCPHPARSGTEPSMDPDQSCHVARAPA